MYSLGKIFCYTVNLVYSLIRNLLASDDYTPVIVETDQQFQGIMEMFNYKDLQIHHVPFPKKLPFSSMVIQIYEQVCE